MDGQVALEWVPILYSAVVSRGKGLLILLTYSSMNIAKLSCWGRASMISNAAIQCSFDARSKVTVNIFITVFEKMFEKNTTIFRSYLFTSVGSKKCIPLLACSSSCGLCVQKKPLCIKSSCGHACAPSCDSCPTVLLPSRRLIVFAYSLVPRSRVRS
jgi:hypothetical protein